MAGPAQAADRLLSQGKPVTASSAGGCCAAPNAVDGDSATRWASAAGVDPQWLSVDLGATAHISRVRLQWDASCATAYEIQTSPDKTTWTKIYATTAGKGGVEDLTTLDGNGRYVRMYGTTRCRPEPSKGYSLQEFGVYGSTSTDTVPPTPPGKPELVAATSNSATVKWPASTDNVGVTGYDIFRNGQLCASVTSTTVGGLSPNTAYHFQVTASDANGNESGGSTPILDVTTPGGSTCTPAQGMCTVEQVGTDNDVVWGLVTLPDGTILFNQRDAHKIVHLNPATGAKKIIGTVPNVQSTGGEGGLTGLEINPATFGTDRWLYIMHTSPSDNRIVRIKYDPVADSLQTGTLQVLVSGIQRNKFHDGGRLRFSPDGRYLFAGTGDAQNSSLAQNKSSLNGKVLRINPDGSVPADNPFGNAVWTLGHRNIQGLAFDAQGRLWEQEFGNSIMDETNLIEKGGNYGWPSCEGTSGSCGGYLAPKRTYSVGSGSCSGITIVRNALYVACQKGERIYRAVISGSSLTDVRQFFNGTYGRLRTVEPAPDGGIWLATSNGGDKDSTPNNSNNRIFHVTVG